MSAARASRTAGALLALTVAVSATSCAFTSDLSGALTGHVLRSGTFQPISGARIECEGVTSVSGTDGSYSLEGIPPGDRVVYAYASGFEDYSDVVNITESTVYDIYMDVYVARARLFGYVEHATLGPIEGAEVVIGDLTVVTDADGFYEFPNLQQQTYSVTVSRDGFRQVVRNVNITSSDYQFDVGMKKLATAVLSVVADAGLRDQSPDANYGGATELELFNNGYVHSRFLVRPELGVEDTAEPVSATLRLYNAVEQGAGEARTILVGRVLLEWDEMDVTWNSPVQTTGASVAPGSYENRWYEITVTGYFADWMVGEEPNYGLLIDTAQDHEADRFTFASREYGEEDKRPHVVLEYAW